MVIILPSPGLQAHRERKPGMMFLWMNMLPFCLVLVCYRTIEAHDFSLVVRLSRVGPAVAEARILDGAASESPTAVIWLLTFPVASI